MKTITLGLLALFVPAALSASLIHEPEEDNQEYMLDQETNYVSLEWREIWEASDNCFFFRLGSNNVREWFMEEKLKAAASLVKDRLRFLFYHTRIDHFTGHRRSFNTMVLEGRLRGRWYLSLLATPRASKKDDTLGFTLTRRGGRNRYFSVYLELPRFLNDFVEGHKQTGDTLLEVYMRSPVRVGVDVRGSIGERIRIRAKGYRTNTFEMSRRSWGREAPYLWGRLGYLMGWVELKGGSEILGLRGGYESAVYRVSSARFVGAGALSPGVSKARGGLFACGRVPAGRADPLSARPSAPPTTVERGGSPLVARASAGRLCLLASGSGGESSLLAAGPGGDASPIGVGPGEGPSRDVEPDPWDGFGYGDGAFSPDAAQKRVEEEEVWWLAPYLSRSMGTRVDVFAEVLFSGRNLIWSGEGVTRRVRLTYVVPVFSARIALGAGGRSLVEGGLAFEHLSREDDTGSDRRGDSRLFAAYERRFGEAMRLRIIESIDLDRRDWGQFSIHDHGFFQAVIGW